MKHYSGTWESIKQHELPKWYDDYKFGIFIHWGLYSVPAFAPRTYELGEVENDKNWYCNNPYAEWYYNSVNAGEGPSYEYHIRKYGQDFAYENFSDIWRAENWNPKEWAELFKRAGARYVILTTKHHEGFCLFPSEYTDFNSVKKGPKRDITGELTRAVRECGLKMGVYYSGIIDWQYYNEPILSFEDCKDNTCPTYEYADYAYKQCMELIDRYKPSVFWNDIGWPRQGVEALPKLLAHYYNTVEDGVINDRFNGLCYDYLTKEYQMGESSRNVKWEMCRGMGLSFGYNAQESADTIISMKEFLRLLVRTVSNNGNLLINVGPKADGTIPEEQIARLEEMGYWLKINGEGIYGTHCSKRENIEDQQIYYTEKVGILYLFAEVTDERVLSVNCHEVSGEPLPLDKDVRISVVRKDNSMKITVHNHTNYEMVCIKFQ